MEDQERVIQNALLMQLFSVPIHAFLVSLNYLFCNVVGISSFLYSLLSCFRASK